MSEIAKITRKKRILIVDDSASLRDAFRRILVWKGKFEVEEASSGIEAATMVEATDAAGPDGQFDAIVTDYNMHGMNGGDLVRFLRASGYSMPIAMVTGDVDSVVWIPGIQALLRKPVGMEQLLAAVNGVLMTVVPAGSELVAESAHPGPMLRLTWTDDAEDPCEGEVTRRLRNPFARDLDE